MLEAAFAAAFTPVASAAVLTASATAPTAAPAHGRAKALCGHGVQMSSAKSYGARMRHADQRCSKPDIHGGAGALLVAFACNMSKPAILNPQSINLPVLVAAVPTASTVASLVPTATCVAADTKHVADTRTRRNLARELATKQGTIRHAHAVGIGATRWHQSLCTDGTGPPEQTIPASNLCAALHHVGNAADHLPGALRSGQIRTEVGIVALSGEAGSAAGGKPR